jgi:hypothetical protein
MTRFATDEGLLLLAKVDEVALLDGVEVPLSVNQYPGALHPRGHERRQ